MTPPLEIRVLTTGADRQMKIAVVSDCCGKTYSTATTDRFALAAHVIA